MLHAGGGNVHSTTQHLVLSNAPIYFRHSWYKCILLQLFSKQNMVNWARDVSSLYLKVSFSGEKCLKLYFLKATKVATLFGFLDKTGFDLSHDIQKLFF